MYTGQRLVQFCVLLVLLLDGGATHAQERDLWYVLSHGEQEISSVHVQVTSTGDDNFRYVWESRVPVNFLGQLQETTTKTEYLVTGDLRPVTMRSEMSKMSGATTVRGELVDDTLTVTSVEDGEETTLASKVAGEQLVLFDSCLGEWLAKQPAGTTAVTLQVIDDATWGLAQVEVAALAPEDGDPRWRVEYQDATYNMTVEVGADGFETERFYEKIDLRMRRCSREEAESIAPLDQTGRQVLSFPVDPPIPTPHRLTELTVELRWKGIPLDDFELEDDRQRLVEHSQDGEDHRALVEVFAPEPIDADLTFPIAAEGLELYLAETEFIKPHDPTIRAAAAEICQGGGSALEAVQALSTWVFGYVDSALIAETLSGPQVLSRKTGKCTEFSTLFASLARSVGIPTRMALGERMVAGQWGGHMWNEVYVGRWIPVDASANEVGATFALLKFIDSDTVAGTQPLRMALPASLVIRVQDFALSGADLAGQYESGIVGSVYTNVDYECRLTAPQPDWVLHDDSASGVATIRFEIPGAKSTFIHFVAFGLPPGTPAKALAESRIELFRPNYDDFEVTTNKPITVEGAQGHTTSFQGRAKGSEVESGITEVIWCQGSFGYILNLIATKAEHEEHFADFEDLLASFEVLTSK